MSVDPEINVQPETKNPHTLSEDETVELSPEVLEQAEDHATSGFEKSRTDPLITAAYVSEKLQESYEDDGVYMMAEVGPSGVHPVAVGDGDRFFIDQKYDPESVEHELSPFSHLETTGYDTELGLSIAQYEVMDLSCVDLQSIADIWESDGIAEELDRTYLVAPGMQETYRDALDQMQ